MTSWARTNARENEAAEPYPTRAAIDSSESVVSRSAARGPAKTDLAGRILRIGATHTGPELAAAVGQALGRTVAYEALTPAAFGSTVGRVLGAVAGKALEADYTLLGTAPHALELDAPESAAWETLGVIRTPLVQWAARQDWAGAAAAWPA